MNGDPETANLFDGLEAAGDRHGPVECLGVTFPNDEGRRTHFLGILREKLKDPEFRKIEGFPIGSDEDILALSYPPCYTCLRSCWWMATTTKGLSMSCGRSPRSRAGRSAASTRISKPGWRDQPVATNETRRPDQAHRAASGASVCRMRFAYPAYRGVTCGHIGRTVIHKRFEVVKVPFPFTDRNAGKTRPALVLSDEGAFNAPIGHGVLAMIASAKHAAWPLDVPVSDPAAAGLPVPSTCA